MFRKLGDTDALGCGTTTPTNGVVRLLQGTAQWNKGNGWLYSDQEIAVDPSAASVGVIGRLAGRSAAAPGWVLYANVGQPLLGRLNLPTPFAVAVAVWHGCVLTDTVQATAFDANGSPLGSAMWPYGAIPQQCKLP
jgi:hypothetical protein